MQIVKITPTIKNYTWGSRDVLPSMFHFKADGKSYAEAWFGLHEAGESKLEDGSSLREYLEASPESLYGKRYKEYLECFPLMLKVLAVNTPLSLHVHPNSIQAQQGWAGEAYIRNRGQDPALLNFKDTNCKNELFYALTPSTLMCGFRDFNAITSHFSRLLPASFGTIFGGSKSTRGILKTLFTLTEARVKEIVDEYLANLQESGEEITKDGLYYTERGISEKIFSTFGYEPSVLVPYMMNVIHMRIGEAIYIRSGILHTYVHGTGIEVENSSDNEIRLGLSDKHRDVQAALNLVDYDSNLNTKLNVYTDSFLRQRADGDSYSLAILRSGSYDIRESCPSFALCTEGMARVGTSTDHIILKEGECCFIPSCDEVYHVRVRGKVFQALFSKE